MLWFVIGFAFLLAAIFKFFSVFSVGRMKSYRCLVGKTVLITGGNRGIGYETALVLASRGCRLIIVDKDDAYHTKQKIIEETGNENIATKCCDLSSFAAIRKLAQEINQTEERLDVLINNAGVGVVTPAHTEDKIVNIMQINHLGHFLLTHLLADLLKRSSPSRVVFVSSLLAFTNNLTVANINKFQKQKLYAYANTKLCSMVATRVFAERLEGSGVTVNCVHPGLVKTEIFEWKEQSLGGDILRRALYAFVVRLFGKTAEEGAQTTLHVAMSDMCQYVTGKFFADCKIFWMPPKALDENFCEKIFAVSEQMVNLQPQERL